MATNLLKQIEMDSESGGSEAREISDSELSGFFERVKKLEKSMDQMQLDMNKLSETYRDFLTAVSKGLL